MSTKIEQALEAFKTQDYDKDLDLFSSIVETGD